MIGDKDRNNTTGLIDCPTDNRSRTISTDVKGLHGAPALSAVAYRNL